jgi:hypothetical protein
MPATTVDRFNSPAHTEHKQISEQTAAAQRATPWADDDGNARGLNGSVSREHGKGGYTMAHLDHKSGNAAGTTEAAGTPQQAIPPISRGQLQHNHGEVIEVDHDMLPATDSHMTAAGPNTTELDMTLMDKPEPTFTAQQDLPIDTSTDGMHQQWDPPLPRPTRGTSTEHARNYCEEEIHQCPIMYEQPYGKREGVAISKSGLSGAGCSLFGIRPSKSNPLLFKQANEFVCVYATMQDAISVTEAQVTESAYVCPGAAGGTQRPRSRPRLCHVLLSFCVSCSDIFVIRYPRTKTHKLRGRAFDVSTIYTCFSLYVMIYCPLPHRSL